MSVFSPQKLISHSLDLAFNSLSAFARLLNLSVHFNKNVQRIKNVTYTKYTKDGVTYDLHLDVLIPKKSVVDKNHRAPVALHIHGGGFRLFSKDSHTLVASKLAQMGYVTFNINYRLAPKHPYPAAFIDAVDAYIWVQKNAHHYGGRLEDGFLLMGESAGANLCLGCSLIATKVIEPPVEIPNARLLPELKSPTHLVPACGYMDISDPARTAQADPRAKPWEITRMQIIKERYLPQSVANPENKDWGFADPLILVEKMVHSRKRMPSEFPRVFIPVGLDDPVRSQSQRLQLAMHELGADSRLTPYAGEPHGFHIMFWRKKTSIFWKDLGSFLSRNL